jgi:dTMP kinase
MNASRAQLVREIIRPALAAGEVILCDRFYDSTVAYQGYGRQLDLATVRQVIDLAVGQTRPDVTLLLHVSVEVSEQRRQARQPNLPLDMKRDRFEESDRAFFERVALGYQAIAREEPKRVRVIDASASVAAVRAAIWASVAPLI